MRTLSAGFAVLTLGLLAGCNGARNGATAEQLDAPESTGGSAMEQPAAGSEDRMAADDAGAVGNTAGAQGASEMAAMEAGQASGTDWPEPDAEAMWSHLQEQSYAESWALWPGTERLYEGTEPHGALLTTYVNETAQDALAGLTGEMPRGSIIVKENYKPPQQLMSVTVMYKASEGYNPEHNDWYWLKRLADGTVEASGRAAGCQACHGVSENDYLRTPLPEEA
jgi:hypothetical protein